MAGQSTGASKTDKSRVYKGLARISGGRHADGTMQGSGTLLCHAPARRKQGREQQDAGEGTRAGTCPALVRHRQCCAHLPGSGGT